MTIDDIRRELQLRGWTQKQLADKLHIHPVTLGLILTGKNKLTPQLAAHIDLIFHSEFEVFVGHKVSLTTGEVQPFYQGIEHLSETEQLNILLDVVRDSALWYIEEQRTHLPPEKIAELEEAYESIRHITARDRHVKNDLTAE